MNKQKFTEQWGPARDGEKPFFDNDLNELIESYAEECAKRAYPNTEADGVVFCGKCGTAI